MNKVIPELDSAGLRKFAFTTAAIVIVLFALLIPFLFGFTLPIWPWVFGIILAAWGAIAPQSLNPVYKLWMRFGLLMSRITTPIILGIVFFLVFTPIAFAMRVLKRDRLKIELDADSDSYRINSTVPDKSKLQKPY